MYRVKSNVIDSLQQTEIYSKVSCCTQPLTALKCRIRSHVIDRIQHGLKQRVKFHVCISFYVSTLDYFNMPSYCNF